jgi:Aspartyl protease
MKSALNDQQQESGAIRRCRPPLFPADVISMSAFKWLASVTLAATAFPVLQAEPHCPGNVASLRVRLVERSQMIAPVTINHTGPYDFLVDTASQITMVDPSLAAELHLKIQGTNGVVGVGFRALAPFAQLDLLQVGSRAIADPLVAVQNLAHLQATDPDIRGILGENFLGHFDLFIDYAHKLLCLDDARVMQHEVKGNHIALVIPPHTEDEAPFTVPLVIPVHLSGSGTRQLLLLLDSGTNVPFLYDPDKYLAPNLFVSVPLRGRSIDGTERAFAVLPPQDMRIATLICHRLSFVTLTGNDRHAPKIQVDGLLTTALFRRVYISYADRFVVLEPW